MSNDPLPLPEILAGSPDEAGDADYDAIYAEVTATERGRRFLIEYASRNRRADKHMLAGALARVEAAMRGDPAQDPATLSRDFAALAAVIGRIEAEIASRSGGLAAAERIQDIAFTLREREVDAALCDALEEAVREMGEAFAGNDAATDRTQSAAALLRDLAGRINAMIAVAVAEAGPEPEAMADAVLTLVSERPGSAVADEAVEEAEEFAEEELVEASDRDRTQVSEAETQQDELLAQAVGALAALFPVPVEAGEPEHETPSEPAGSASVPVEHQESESPFGEPIDASLHEAPIDVIALERPEPVEAGAEPSSIEPSPMQAVAGGAPATEQIEPAIIAHEQVAEPVVDERPADERPAVFAPAHADDQAVPAPAAQVVDVSQPIAPPIEAETQTGTGAEAAAANESHAAHAGNVGGFTEGPHAPHSSYVISVETLLGEALVSEKLPSTDFHSEESPGKDASSEERASDGRAATALPGEEAPSPESSSGQLPAEEEPSRAFRSEESPSQETLNKESSSEQLLNDEIPSFSSEASPSEEPSSEASPSEEPSSQAASSGQSRSEEIPSAAFPNEESPGQASSAEPLLSEQAAPSGAMAGNQSTDAGIIGARQILVPGVTEPVEHAAQQAADPANETTDDVVADASGGSHEGERLDDVAVPATAIVVDTPSSQPDSAPLSEARPAHPLLPDTEPLPSPEEDPADLFEPLPSPIPSPPAAPVPAAAPATTSDGAANIADAVLTTHDHEVSGGDNGPTDGDVLPSNSLTPEGEDGLAKEMGAGTSAAEGDAANRIFSAESPAPALPPASVFAAPTSPPPPMAITPPGPTAAPPRANLAAAMRSASRPAANDPLAALRALSEEELIALFS